MKFKDLYERGLDRKVNPAVSASDLSEDTVLTEIVEYVFTQNVIGPLLYFDGKDLKTDTDANTVYTSLKFKF